MLDLADIGSVTQFRARFGLPAQLFCGTESQYVDLSNALHLHTLPRLLARCSRVQLTEALPVPSGQVLEIFAETYRRPE